MQKQLIDNYYSKPHLVLITLIGIDQSFKQDAVLLNNHADYYRKQSGKLVSYGYAMNRQAVCIVLNVNNDEDFENIIANDPGLVSGWLEADTVMPYKI